MPFIQSPEAFWAGIEGACRALFVPLRGFVGLWPLLALPAAAAVFGALAVWFGIYLADRVWLGVALIAPMLLAQFVVVAGLTVRYASDQLDLQAWESWYESEIVERPTERPLSIAEVRATLRKLEL